MKNEDKTNVMRILEQKNVDYKCYTFECDGSATGADVARGIGVEPERCFKTLVTVGKSGEHYVFDIPVQEELDLKKAAAAVGEKNIEMIKQAELLFLTGYIHGGCSPVGMKKFFRTTFHETAANFEKITFSAGKIGKQVEVSPADLPRVIRFGYADIIK